MHEETSQFICLLNDSISGKATTYMAAKHESETGLFL